MRKNFSEGNLQLESTAIKLEKEKLHKLLEKEENNVKLQIDYECKIEEIRRKNLEKMRNKELKEEKRRKEKDGKKIILNKSKEKDNKIISIKNKSKEKDNKIIVLNKSKGKDKKMVNINSKSKGKEGTNENKKEPVIQKSVTSTNKLTKNIKEVKKGNKSPNPGNGIIKKKIILGNPKQKQGPVLKISPGKIPKEKINSSKGRLNTDNNSEIKKQINKQGLRPVKTSSSRKGEKSPNPNLASNKK